MRRVLAFFGAFNPPTVAHVELARFAMDETGREGVIFVPSKSAYIEDDQGKDFAYGETRRLEMLSAIAGSRPWMRVSDWELRAQTQPRTYDTLCQLRSEGYGPELLIGSDKLPELQRIWLHVEDIAREFGFVCLTRGCDDCARLLAEDAYLHTLAPYIRLLETPAGLRGVSSTEVRRLLTRPDAPREAIRALVPAEVAPLLYPIQ